MTREQEVELSLKVNNLIKEYVGFEAPFVLIFPEKQSLRDATLLSPVSPEFLPGILMQAAEMCASNTPTRVTLVNDDGTGRDLSNVIMFPGGRGDN